MGDNRKGAGAQKQLSPLDTCWPVPARQAMSSRGITWPAEQLPAMTGFADGPTEIRRVAPGHVFAAVCSAGHVISGG